MILFPNDPLTVFRCINIQVVNVRLTFRTAEGTNIVAACAASGLHWVDRVERSVRYALTTVQQQPLSAHMRALVVNSLQDRSVLYVCMITFIQ